MPISGNSSYIPTANDFLAHWQLVLDAAPATPFKVKLLNDTLVARADFETMRNLLQSQDADVRAKLTYLDLARGTTEITKVKLLERLNQFIVKLDGKWQNTSFYTARPYAPGIRDGQKVFTDPMFDMMTLWASINAGPTPAGVTLPLVLPPTDLQAAPMTQGEFASLLSTLQFQFADERRKLQEVTLSRADRDRTQAKMYVVMKIYREDLPSDMMAFPTLVETMPRLTPLPGHTPQPVNATATFEAPDKSRIVYGESTDPTLYRYQLRGHVGTEYDEDYAEVIDNHAPGDPREFITSFGLSEPGVHMVFKVFVILTTDNEAGSAPMVVQRPISAVA